MNDNYPPEAAEIARLAGLLAHNHSPRYARRVLDRVSFALSPFVAWGKPPMADLVAEACAKFQIKQSNVLAPGKLRGRELLAMREAAAAMRAAGYSYPKIGAFFGRDPSTIYYHIKGKRRSANA